MSGSLIRIYLPSGDPRGIKIAEVCNRTQKFLAGSLLQIEDLYIRPEIKRSGVYCLVGDDLENSNYKKVYIGQGEEVSRRIKNHLKDEEYDFVNQIIFL